MKALVTSSAPILSLSRSRRAMMVPWSLGDTITARGSGDSDITSDSAELPVPIVLIIFKRSRCWRFDYDLRDYRGLCSCSHCRSVAFSFVWILAVVSFAPARGVCFAVKPGIGASIPCSTITKYWIINLDPSSVCVSFCPGDIPRRGSVRTQTPASGCIGIWLQTWTRVIIYVDVQV